MFCFPKRFLDFAKHFKHRLYRHPPEQKQNKKKIIRFSNSRNNLKFGNKTEASEKKSFLNGSR